MNKQVGFSRRTDKNLSSSSVHVESSVTQKPPIFNIEITESDSELDNTPVTFGFSRKKKELNEPVESTAQFIGFSRKAKKPTTATITLEAQTLSERHRAELRQSGIDDEIIDLNFKSLTTEQVNKFLKPAKTFGIGFSISLTSGGWVCGSIVKPDVPRKIRNKPIKYEVPLGTTPLPTKLELPESKWQAIAQKFGIEKPPDLDGWKWVEEHPQIPVVVCEGIKKAGCIISQIDIPAIAINGHTMAYEKNGDVRFPELIQPERQIILCFDEDTSDIVAENVAKTIKGIGFRLNKKVKGVKESRANLLICSWIIPGKGIDDIWLTHGKEVVQHIIDTATPWGQWVDLSHARLGFEPDFSFVSKQWVPSEIPEDKILVCLKGEKGTGKSWFMERLARQAILDNRPLICMTHRIQLSLGLSKRLNLVYIDELSEKTSEAKRIALVIDSLCKINPANFAGGYLFIDEIVQTVEHLMFGDTCKYKRVQIFKALRELFRIITETGGKIVVADADLDANTLRFLIGLSGEKPHIIQNNYREKSYTCYVTNGYYELDSRGTPYLIYNPADIVAVALEKAQRGERLYICCTGQKEYSVWTAHNLELLFNSYGVNSTICIDSFTVKNPDHPAFKAASRINEICDTYQIVIATPTLGTGVSIENKIPFNLVLGIFSGVGSPDAVRQALMRVRDTKVPRLIYCAYENVNKKFESLGTNEKTVADNAKSLIKFQQNFLNHHDEEWSKEFPEYGYNYTASHYFSKSIAKENKQKPYFKNYILQGLKHENVTVICTEFVQKDFNCTQYDAYNLKEEMKGIKASTFHGYEEKLVNQELLTPENYQNLKGATEVTEAEKIAVDATALSQKYGGIAISGDLIELDNYIGYDAIRLHYACTAGREYLNDIQALRSNNQLRSSDGELIEHDFLNSNQLLGQVELIESSELLSLIEDGESSEIETGYTFHKFDDKSNRLYDYTVENLETISLLSDKKLSRTQFKSGQFNFRLINLVYITLLGFKVAPNPAKLNGKTVTTYHVYPEHAKLRQEIFALWKERDRETIKRWQERKKEWEIKRLVGQIYAEMHLTELERLKQLELFNEAWELVDTAVRIDLINRQENYVFPEPVVKILDPHDSNYENILADINSWSTFAIDLETFGNDKKNKEGLHARKGCIRLIQISDGQTVYIIDLGSRNADRNAIKNDFQKVLSLLDKKLQSPDILKINHNIHFDLRFLSFQLNFGKARNVSDTMKGAQVFFGDYGGLQVLPGGYGLGNLCKKLLGLELDKTEQKSDWGSDDLTTSQIEYAALDPYVTFHVHDRLEQLYTNPVKFGFGKLAQAGIREAWQLENNVIPCAVELEKVGLPINRDLAVTNIEKCRVIQTELLTQWSKLVPEINYTQNKKLIQILESKYNLVITSLNKSKLADLKDLPEIQLLSKLRAIKVPIQQLESLLRSSEATGRVQTTFKTLTGTGRFSSGDSKNFNDLPNLQSMGAKENPALEGLNVPNVRSCIQPQSGRGFAVIDLAGSHARIAADLAHDETAASGLNDDSVDNHSKVAEFVARSLNHDISWQDIQTNKKAQPFKGYRDTAKNTFYGWINDAGARRVQEQIQSNSGKTVDIKACEGALKGCDNLFPSIRNYKIDLETRLQQPENLITIDNKQWIINRIDRVENRITHDFDKGRIPRPKALAATWSRIEATALKKSLIEITELAENNPLWNLKIINYVHDELDFEFDLEHGETVITTVNNIIGDNFQKMLTIVKDGRETDWTKSLVKNWSEK